MDFLWWQVCLINISKGISWSIPIFSLFFAVTWLINDLIKDTVEKVKDKMKNE